MILKIKDRNEWVYYDKIDKIVDKGEREIVKEGNDVRIKHENGNSGKINIDNIHLSLEKDKVKGKMVGIKHFDKQKSVQFEKQVIFKTGNAFILNDVGKTIERL